MTVPHIVRVRAPCESKYRPADIEPAKTANEDTDEIQLRGGQLGAVQITHMRRHNSRNVGFGMVA